MAVLFSKVPDNFASAFGDLVYGISGMVSGSVENAEVLAGSSDVPVGVKRVVGGEGVAVNISGYVRRMLAPSPVLSGNMGISTDNGLSVVAAVSCGGAVSPVRTFTGAGRGLSEYEAMTVLPAVRTIGWDEWDTVSVPVSTGSISYRWETIGGTGYSYTSEAVVVSRSVATLSVDMAEVRRVLGNEGVDPEGVTGLKVSVLAGQEAVVSLEYEICRRPSGAVRLCWFNTMGGFDFHTFGASETDTLDAGKEVFLNYNGYRTASVQNERQSELVSGYMPRLWIEGLSGIVASPLVWRVDEDGYIPVDVLSGEAAIRREGLNYVSVKIRDAVPPLRQNF